MKDGLIRIINEKDIFYDSVEKVYRYRMHCPNCRKVADSCQCYYDLDALLSDIDDDIANYTCSAKCALLLLGEWDELNEAMQVAGIKKKPYIRKYPKIEELTEKQCSMILEILTEGGDMDNPSGHRCKL